MAGYSGTPLVRKLGIKEGSSLALSRPPEGFDVRDPGQGPPAPHRLKVSGDLVKLVAMTQGIRRGLAVAGVAGALLLSACGGGDGSSDSPQVGDCIDDSNQVVDCGSSDATKKLTTDQSAPDAIACVAIGDNPAVEVKVGDGTFCAEDL
jgi:hypothetical protein